MLKLLHPCFILLLMFCSGCAYQQTVKVKYPIWGEERYLATDETGSRHMQILMPAQPESAGACLLIVHGMNEHIGRYGDIARYFSDRFIVAGMDMTAHGLSNSVLLKAHKSIEAGASAYDAGRAFLEQAQLRDLQPMRNDLEQALGYLIKRCDKLSGNNFRPVFILSHSLGSLVSASYLLQTKNEALKSRIKGIIFSGPAFSATEVPGWRGRFENPLIRFTFHTHEHFLNPHGEPLPLLLLNQLLALITVPLQDGLIELVSLPGLRNLFSPTSPDWVSQYLSDSEEERTRQRNDNYIMRRCVLRYVLGVEQEIIRFRRNMAGFDTPYLLIYSEQDPITPAWGNIDFAAVTRNNHQHNELMQLIGKGHHEQLFSTPALREQILHKIDDWIERRMGNGR
ncbi:MAG: alpha/beta hydrolase [Methylococcales bacterium]|nr:alpha/beta hydrolase [Methylococcales bacterium]